MANTAGIQTLLEAEKEASKIVQKARQYRVQRLKDARAEAAKEIDGIKAQKQAEFNSSQQQDVGSVDASVAKVTQETEQNLVKIDQEYAAHKAEVIKKLLDQVTSVQPKMHPNALNPHTAW